MRENRLLLLIVGGVVLLVVVALGVAVAGPGTQYRADDSPTNVVYNYITALQKGDYARAYSYLDPELPGYPQDVAEFEADLDGWEFQGRGGTRYSMGSERVAEGSTTATVRGVADNPRVVWFSAPRRPFTMSLVRTDDGWKITDGDELFSYTWNR